MLKKIKKIIERYRKDEKNKKSILLRPFLLPNKLKKTVEVMKEKWDYLIVLDACRYDTFKKITAKKIEGNLHKKNSLGTHTAEWLINNFPEKNYNIVYVSGTPQVSRVKLKKRLGNENPFFHLEDVWNWGWDENLGTVHPKTVNKSAKKLKDRYPKKRMIIHYLQPHSPFIGKKKIQKNKKRMKWRDRVRKKKLSKTKVRKAYESNLRLVTKHVKTLVKNLDGKIVITSDHGENFGELGLFSHLPAMYMKSLMQIPWHVIRN
mgnify:FL=1